ncbi:MAG: SRPBCC family protein [Polyangia bacterium]
MEMVAEEVTVFEPPTRMKYRVLRGGGPIRNHDGEVLFVAVPGGTQVTWRVEFEPTIPGLRPAIKTGVRAFHSCTF